MDLNTIWFVLVGVLFTGYMMLDGFDLGTGPLLLLAGDDRDRRICLNAIGPVWNGNEVWLVTGGGALFAAFSDVYATVFSGFYDIFMFFLTALIFRASAIEFRSQREELWWRQFWDIMFALSSLASALVIGIVLGNFVWGIPLDAKHDYQGDLFTLLHPYALFAGVSTIALFTMHANIYLILKTDGELQKRAMTWTRWTVPVYLVCFMISNGITLLLCPHIVEGLRDRPVILGGVSLLLVLAAFNIRRTLLRQRTGAAFLSSCLTMALHMLMLGVAAFPTLVFSTPNHENDMTIYTSASSPKTLEFMFWVAVIGVPIVLTYTATVYYVFRGKVVLSEDSY